jgi:glycosyltransferase involved in cell wall biosynthesis
MLADLSICSKLMIFCPKAMAKRATGEGPKKAEWHLLTPEYPPQLGGVSDYTFQLAAGLANSGEEVHVWAPGTSRVPSEDNTAQAAPFEVHRECGSFHPADLRILGHHLDQFPAPRRLLVQWVPHGYGYRSMNLPLCWWIYRRAVSHQDRIELMVHEPFLSFSWTSPRQSLAALVHRCMAILLLRAALRVWVSIPGWERVMRAYTLGRDVSFQWLPIFSNIPAASDPSVTQSVRWRYTHSEELLIGHFGTFGKGVSRLLDPIISALAQDSGDRVILLMGEGSEEYRCKLISQQPQLENVIGATGKLPAWELSHHLAACDLLIQPYPDGASTRRGSLMAGLENGKSIVTTTGWLTEPLWAESGAVALAPAGDIEAFLKTVRRLCADRTERVRLETAARRLYRERFDISRTIGSLRQARAAAELECASS